MPNPMTCLNLVAAVFLVCPPQDAPKAPAHGAGTETPILHAELLPPGTLAAISLHPLAPHEDELEQTGLARLLGSFPVPQEIMGFKAELLGKLTEVTGFDEAQLKTLTRHGLTLAWAGNDSKGAPQLLLVVGLAGLTGKHEEILTRAMGKTREHGASISSELLDKHTLWCLRTSALPVLYVTVDSGIALFATSHKLLADALLRRTGHTQSLCDSERFTTWASLMKIAGSLANSPSSMIE